MFSGFERKQKAKKNIKKVLLILTKIKLSKIKDWSKIYFKCLTGKESG